MATTVFNHNTDQEIIFLDAIVKNVNTPLQKRNKDEKINALKGYISASSNRNWGSIDGRKCINYAHTILRDLETS